MLSKESIAVYCKNLTNALYRENADFFLMLQQVAHVVQLILKG
jgi:hypothetical protein